MNGLRSVYRKNFLKWFEKERADIVCLQEIKLQENQIPKDLLDIDGYSLYLKTAKKKGYSGLAIYTKTKPLSVSDTLGIKRFDDEGRFLKLEYPEFVLIGIYMPHGGRKKENLEYKLKSYDYLRKYLSKIKNRPVVLAGDFNIARTDLDLMRPKQNRKNIMFTPEERKKVDRLINLGFVDTFRIFNNGGGHYTWWPYMANARERNLGWRIDYILVAHSLVPKIKKAFILREVRGSDHCPVGINLFA